MNVGDKIGPATFPIQRINLVMYCGASGDFNVIHWNERIATAVGLPNVIAHGMFTMAQAARVLTDFVGDPSRVIDYGVRFTKPVPVPDDDIGTAVEVTGTISESATTEQSSWTSTQPQTVLMSWARLAESSAWATNHSHN